MRSMVEGAWASALRLRGRTIVHAAAPSTTLLRSVVPLPRLRGAGGKKARRENDETHPSPRSGGGGPCVAWWRGPGHRHFACVAEQSSTLPPLPPRKCAVPPPRYRGAGGKKARRENDVVYLRPREAGDRPQLA